MNVVVVASEMRPFSKTGGLADVAGALPIALALWFLPAREPSLFAPLHKVILSLFSWGARCGIC